MRITRVCNSILCAAIERQFDRQHGSGAGLGMDMTNAAQLCRSLLDSDQSQPFGLRDIEALAVVLN
jgi:hypothetical protein